MTKREFDLLEEVFSCEMLGNLYQKNSKLAKELESEGYLVHCEKSLGRDRFGEIVVSGYALTLQGNHAYCSSEQCGDVEGVE